jgi:cob(I)alamin adenosyltransferase
MVKLNRIYTRTGDDGTTGLSDGTRVRKDHARIEAYGTVDELNSLLGLAARALAEAGPSAASGPPASPPASGDVDPLALLHRIQNDLFDLGADLSTPGVGEALRIVPAQVAALEHAIDAVNARLQPLTSFVLPGGSAASAWLHLARTICRRAERHAIALGAQEPINPQAAIYLNRLSDLLFVLGRAANDGGAQDVLWVPGRYR